ncbi:MAG TPA: hypothetical protein VG603_11055 [Chitinophagales bacterium]|nr:hypothetical protein [Chitinophagales bacterium]
MSIANHNPYRLLDFIPDKPPFKLLPLLLIVLFVVISYHTKHHLPVFISLAR